MLQERGHDPRRVKMAAVCSVCADPFVNYMARVLARPSPNSGRRARGPRTRGPQQVHRRSVPHEVRRSGHRQRHQRHGVGAQARRHGLQGPGRREGSQRRREDDPAEQGLPHARLRQLHLHAQDGRHHPPSQPHRAHLLRGGEHRAGERRLQGQDQAEASLRGPGGLHRLPPVRDELQRGGARPVQRRPGLAAGSLHRLPAGGPQESGHRARGHFPLHLHLPGGHQGPRVRGPHPQRRVREGLPAGRRRHPAGRQPGPGLLRPLRVGMHPGRASTVRSTSGASSASLPTPTTRSPESRPRDRRRPTARRWPSSAPARRA